jgi:NAD(P)-dependent dehydrogenase (short-subunit alcohol dehydrogenase family)
MNTPGSIALVTGASSGIGKATAERLATAGYKVYGTSRRGAQTGQRSFAMLPLDAVNERVKEVMATAEQPSVVADTVLKAASAARPKLRYTAGGLASRLRLLRRFAPVGLVDAGIRKDLRLDAVPVAKTS